MNNYMKCALYDGELAIRERIEFFDDTDPKDTRRAYDAVLAYQLRAGGGKLGVWRTTRVPGEWDTFTVISEAPLG